MNLIHTLLIFLLPSSFVACGQSNNERTILGEGYARQEVKKAIAEKKNQQSYNTIIKDKQTAIIIAEAIVFNIYGKDQIISERPYECYLIDGFWYIAGTIPKNWKGGGFEIIISAKNAQVIKLTHYK